VISGSVIAYRHSRRVKARYPSWRCVPGYRAGIGSYVRPVPSLIEYLPVGCGIIAVVVAAGELARGFELGSWRT